MSEEPIGDLLSAASLLLAVVGVLYGLWYPEITAALKTPVQPHKEDNAKAFNDVSSVLKARAAPLALMALSLGLIFLPDAIKICVEAWNTAYMWQYDAVRAAFCLVVVFSLSIGIHTTGLAVQLAKHRIKLDPS